MANLNKVLLAGHLGRDGEVRYTPGGAAVLSFSIATTDKWTSKDGQRNEKTEWHNVEMWGKSVEKLSEYLTKGKAVFVEGSIATDEYVGKDGLKKRNTKIKAQRIEFLGSGKDRDEVNSPPPSSLTQHSEPLTDDEFPFMWVLAVASLALSWVVV